MAQYTDYVKDPDGNPLARTVRAHDPSTFTVIDEQVSSASDGSFTLSGTAGNFIGIVLAGAADNWNDIVFEGTLS